CRSMARHRRLRAGRILPQATRSSRPGKPNIRTRPVLAFSQKQHPLSISISCTRKPPLLLKHWRASTSRSADILVRFGTAPKRAILRRTEEPFKKIVRKFTLPDGSEQKLEVLSNGQQVVCYGLHKDTHQPYRWHGGEPGAVCREDLPYVRQADMEAFANT